MKICTPCVRSRGIVFQRHSTEIASLLIKWGRDMRYFGVDRFAVILFVVVLPLFGAFDLMCRRPEELINAWSCNDSMIRCKKEKRNPIETKSQSDVRQKPIKTGKVPIEIENWNPEWINWLGKRIARGRSWGRLHPASSKTSVSSPLNHHANTPFILQTTDIYC